MKKHIYEFCVDYWAWATKEQTRVGGFSSFSPQHGLCFNIVRWAVSKGLPERDLLDTIRLSFDGDLPFNKNSFDYFQEKCRNECHKNRGRLNWVWMRIFEHESQLWDDRELGADEEHVRVSNDNVPIL